MRENKEGEPKWIYLNEYYEVLVSRLMMEHLTCLVSQTAMFDHNVDAFPFLP